MIEDIEEAKSLLMDYDDLSDDNIDDVITEIADSEVDIYSYDRRKWLIESDDHTDLLDEAISEFGWEGCGEELDGAIGAAQYLANERLLREAWEELKE